MNEPIKKTTMLNTRLRRVDRALLEALCNWRGCNLSDVVRQAITNEAAKAKRERGIV